MNDKLVTAVIVGAGHRSLCYSEYATRHPEKLRIVGVAEPNGFRRRQVAARFNIPSERCFETALDLARTPVFADAAINGTMDEHHVPTSIDLIEAGYHLLLEKPIGISPEEVLVLLGAARRTGKKVMICHVLRYAPFYTTIKRLILEGRLGTILNIQTSEHVSYHHMSAAFVRGKWNRQDKCGSSFLMAKCCHDLDLIAWLKSGIHPVMVASMGGRSFFIGTRAPAGSGTRCLLDCPIENDCTYSARKLYIDHPDRWGEYVWHKLESLGKPTIEQKIHSLKTDNPHGRCIWKSDNNVVDHQSVVVQFADGATATHSLVGGVAEACRRIHVVGTKGEIYGRMEDGFFTIARPDVRSGRETAVEQIKLDVAGDMHGGGDLRLVEDFVNSIAGRGESMCSTRIEDSINGHLMGFAADRAMRENKVVCIDVEQTLQGNWLALSEGEATLNTQRPDAMKHGFVSVPIAED